VDWREQTPQQAEPTVGNLAKEKNEAHSSHGAVLRDGPLAPAKITFSFLYAKQT